ncbi:MAG: GDSL-type esterase/lipase family protein [Sphaerochaeta sp.]|jgi:lysophospholipase L1-like esterase|nr:GDSL-type esterase/lipase family protein [Sphaerochaeta sp.]MCI2045373.1 GDSL-type esterase/lipase family protein [Sphaerochaeta sp.]MCI2075746.1 GDSL-type esterase/lipase family protein [Sphaerochaeta sp.]MCI2097107.1 GDSL-type esterase/lipase family protein [Sphaerochaeta sp.]MCI2103503.1 GDSL-type esterase/lipase family protein [Sphaerochaeta sp.]
MPITSIACVGDSITYGYGLDHRETTCYPSRLGELLGRSCVVGNFGLTGAVVQPDRMKSYDSSLPYQESIRFQPDIVVVLLGTNDTKPWYWRGEEIYRTSMQALLTTYQKLPSHPKVYTLLVPASRPNRFCVRNSMTIRERTVLRTLPFPCIPLPDNLAGDDGVHPGEAGAEAIAKAVFSFLFPEAKSAGSPQPTSR